MNCRYTENHNKDQHASISLTHNTNNKKVHACPIIIHISETKVQRKAFVEMI